MKQGINADLQTYSELYHMHVIPFFLEKFGDDNCYCEINFLFTLNDHVKIEYNKKQIPTTVKF